MCGLHFLFFVGYWVIATTLQFSRMRQRLRRPLRYGSSLKRASLAPTLNKMPGPSVANTSALARPHHSSSMMAPQPPTTTVNITWPPEEDGNGTGSSFVLQVCLDSQGQKQLQQKQQQPPNETPPSITDNLPDQTHISPGIDEKLLSHFRLDFTYYFFSELERDFFRPPSILLHTPVKGGSIGWGAASTASSLPSTPHRLQGFL